MQCYLPRTLCTVSWPSGHSCGKHPPRTAASVTNHRNETSSSPCARKIPGPRALVRRPAASSRGPAVLSQLKSSNLRRCALLLLRDVVPESADSPLIATIQRLYPSMSTAQHPSPETLHGSARHNYSTAAMPPQRVLETSHVSLQLQSWILPVAVYFKCDPALVQFIRRAALFSQTLS
ncbi:hypothetical protein IQ07DRAFT_24074 [Pyrenochaeta sp. DS3sAY3a]|nr:hypothetical protein IQ07DRAFT_24074 [Pyrenochaeta sp. DS3sAY3a]